MKVRKDDPDIDISFTGLKDEIDFKTGSHPVWITQAGPLNWPADIGLSFWPVHI